MPSPQSDFLRALYQSWGERLAANPSMSLADMRDLFEEWEKPTREPEDVTYKSDTVGGVECVWAYPIGCDRSSVLMFYHGGGFVVGSISSHRKLAGHVAKACGVSAVILEYRRAPEHPFPAQIEDAVAVYKALLAGGIKPRNVGSVGDSAGGNLAVSSVLKFRDLGMELPRGTIALSPWLDMEMETPGTTLETNAATDALASREILTHMRNMFVGGPGPNTRNPLANPLHAEYRGFPPLYISVGGAEVLLDDSRRLHARAQQAGVSSVLSVVDDMQHVFHFLAGRAPEADEEIRRIGHWYRGL
jgi:acetyl esterase/lipase